MRCRVLHESKGRLRVHAIQSSMTLRQADILEYYLRATEGVTDVKVYDRTGDAIIFFACDRAVIIAALSRFCYEREEELVPENTGRELNRQFEDRLTFMVLRRAAAKLFLPASLQAVAAAAKSVKYIFRGGSARFLAEGCRLRRWMRQRLPFRWQGEILPLRLRSCFC